MKSFNNFFRKNNFFRNFILALFLASFLILKFSSPAFSQAFPERPYPPRLINDFAKIYSDEEVKLLEEKLIVHNDKTSTQIVAVSINSLGGYPIDDYTVKLANKWAIGEKGKNNGLLILIAKEDKKIYIATGYGMEGALNDGKLGTIIRTQIIPYFKNANYYAGTNAGIDYIIAADTLENIENKTNYSIDPYYEKVGTFLALLILSILTLWGFISFIKYVKEYASLNNMTFWQAWPIAFSSIFKNKNNNNDDDGFGSGGNSGSGGNGFGGSGGGSFGGGGAGGSWR